MELEKIALRKQKVHNLHRSPNIIQMIKWRKIRWAGHVVRIEERRNGHKVFVGKPEGKRAPVKTYAQMAGYFTNGS
jgi:hypothetical protein